MLTLLAAATIVAAPQTFEGLTIDLPVKATQTQAAPERKVWEAVETQTFASGGTQVNHRVTVMISDFAALQPKPTPEQMLAAHEENFRRRIGFTSVFARRTEGKAGAIKAVMFYGYGRDPEGGSHTLTSAAFPKGSKLYEVVWVTGSHRREVPLASIPKIKFDGAPVAGWTSSAEGEYSMNEFPFAVSGKLFIGAEVWKPETGYAAGYFASTLTGKDVLADTRFMAVKLKPGDKRTDREIFKNLAYLGMVSMDADDQIPDLSSGAGEKTAEFKFLDVTYLGRAVYMRKGDYVGLLTVTGVKSPALLAELKKPTLRYLPPVR